MPRVIDQADVFNRGEFAGPFLPRSAAVPARPDVSVAGVLLLSAVAVVLAILGALLLSAVLLGAWWLVVHIPVPHAVTHLLALLHIA
jgi:hypothetical protein